MGKNKVGGLGEVAGLFVVVNKGPSMHVLHERPLSPRCQPFTSVPYYGTARNTDCRQNS
jgi:hypothetical protein